MSNNRSSLGEAVSVAAAGAAAAAYISSSGAEQGDVNSTSSPSSTRTNVLSGRNKSQISLRSIVMSPTCYYLFHGFNPGCTHRKVFFGPSEGLAEPDFTTKKSDDRDTILAAACSKRSKIETTTITKAMSARICKLESLKHLITFAEGGVKTGAKHPPRLDIAHGKEEDKILLGFVEVGLTNEKAVEETEPGRALDRLFWEKVDQAMNYLGLLSDTRAVTTAKQCKGDFALPPAKTSGTMLFSVIVLNRDRKFGRIAVFACEEKDYASFDRNYPSENWRVALMWRKEGEIGELSSAFGVYITALEGLEGYNAKEGKRKEVWEYLGPNCTKVSYTEGENTVR